MYEIEFLPVGNGASSGDAIVMRYVEDGQWRVGVIDGGYAETGQIICDHIRQHYGTEVIDFVVCTHPDNDHMSGLRVVLEQMTVRRLYVHVPWAHADRITHHFRDPRWTADGLTAELRRQYPLIAEIRALAAARGVEVRLPFQGEVIGPFRVLSPSVEMYEGLLPQFRDTPDPDRDFLDAMGHWIQAAVRVARAIARTVREVWDTETLREGGATAAENETSVVLYGDLGEGGILLTGDAGLRALNAAVDYAQSINIEVSQNLWLFQVPHHGSRNNLAPSILNRIIGPPLPLGSARNIRCIVSAGVDDPDHPRQVVVNALLRRGTDPQATKGQTICYQSRDMLRRQGWNPAPLLGFSSEVEEYD